MLSRYHLDSPGGRRYQLSQDLDRIALSHVIKVHTDLLKKNHEGNSNSGISDNSMCLDSSFTPRVTIRSQW